MELELYMDVKARKAIEETYREAIFFLCHGCSVFRMVIIFIAEFPSFSNYSPILNI